MNPPKRSRFMGTDYRITYPAEVRGDPTDECPEGDSRYGQTIHATRIIEVEQGLAHDHKCEIILHETIHQLCLMLEIGLADEDEQKVATVLSRALIGHMRDNPTYWSYLRSRPPKDT